MIERRLFIAGVIAVLAAPIGVQAQQVKKIPVIGYLDAPTPSLTQHLCEAFRQGLQQHGWIEGRNVLIEYRSAEGRNERFPEMAAEMASYSTGDLELGRQAARLVDKILKGAKPADLPVVQPVRCE
jgi:putative ABC transport system substrate-binding protein